MDLTDIYRAFHPKAKEYTFFSEPHGTFSKTEHIIGHKTSLNRYKNIEHSILVAIEQIVELPQNHVCLDIVIHPTTMIMD